MLDTYGNEFKIPDFTIKQIRDAIPAHCFHRSAATSLYYVFRDMTILASVFYLFHNYVTPEFVPSMPARVALWTLYTIVQGLFGTGVWVLAHECGHQAFSPSKVLNDTVGWICHSFLLVPYFSWKISHGKHHKATGNLARDMVFVPKTRDQYASRVGKTIHELGELMEDTPILTATNLILQQLFGWPMYLLTNVTGHNNHEKQPEGRGKGKANGWFGGVNHFNPSSPLYEAKDAKLIALSDLGLFLMGTALYYVGSNYGWLNLLVWYGIPYLWVNHWLGKSIKPFLHEAGTANASIQWPLPSSNTPILPSPTTSPRCGILPVVRPPPLTVTLASSAATSSTGSSRPTCCTTTSATFPSTTRTRPARRSSPSWATTTAPMPTPAGRASSRPCGQAPVPASGLSRLRVPAARARACSSTATPTALVFPLPSWPNRRHSWRSCLKNSL